MNEIEKTQTNKQSLMKVQTAYIENITKGLHNLLGDINQYQSICGFNVLKAINEALAKEGADMNDKRVNRDTINNAILFALTYELNVDNKEIFVIVRKEYFKGEDGKNHFKSYNIECKPMYRGQLKIVSKFGENVKRIYPEWIVRENDKFTYPSYKGIEILPPEWTPTYEGKIVRVVVPVEYTDGHIEYRIAERESIATNIKAQIKQNLMYAKIDNKDAFLEHINSLSLDELLKDNEAKRFINQTYTGISADEMLITKLIINATKRIAIDYGSAFKRELLEKTYDNSDVYVKEHRTVDEVLPQLEVADAEVKEFDSEGELVEPTPEQKVETATKEVADLFNDDDTPF